MSNRQLPLASKKFVAYLVAELSWKIVLIVALVVFRQDFATLGHTPWWLLMSIVVTAGFVEIGYIGGQAWLDRYVRVAEIARGEKKDEGEAEEG